MSGVALVAASGIGFGVFQSLNVRAVRGLQAEADAQVLGANAARLLGLQVPAT